jgi:hypothetical protein
MGRKGDRPGPLARVTDGSPRRAILLIGPCVTGGALQLDLVVSWSFWALDALLCAARVHVAEVHVGLRATATRHFDRERGLAPLERPEVGLLTALAVCAMRAEDEPADESRAMPTG